MTTMIRVPAPSALLTSNVPPSALARARILSRPWWPRRRAACGFRPRPSSAISSRTLSPGALDGDPGVEGERFDQRLVIVAELGCILLVGEVQAPDDLAGDSDGHPQERVHRRVVGREAVALRMRGDGPNPVRAVLADDQAQQDMATRQIADGASLVGADPAGDELGDQALIVDDAERRVLGGDQLADAVDDQLQDLLDVEDAADAPDRGVERL